MNDCRESISPLNVKTGFTCRDQACISVVCGLPAMVRALLRGHLEVCILQDLITVHHHERASARVDPYIERDCPRPPQNKFRFAEFGLVEVERRMVDQLRGSPRTTEHQA